MIETFEQDDVSLSDLPTAAAPDDPSEVADLFLWCDAARGLWHDLDFAVLPFVRDVPCELYPAEEADVHLWDDVRADATLPYMKSRNAIGNQLVVFADEKLNRGRRTIEHKGNGGFEIVTRGERPWGLGGFTMVICARLNSNAAQMTFLLVQREPDLVELLLWRDGDVFVHGSAGDVIADYRITGVPSPGDGDLKTIVLRVTPSVSTKVYFNGGAAVAQSVSAPAAMPFDETVPEIGCLALGSGLGPLREAGIGVQGHHWTNSIMLFRRALTDAEVNAIGQRLAATYGAPWSDLA